VVIHCQGEKLHCHSSLLAAHSDSLDAMLRSPMVEGQKGEIAIEDFSAEVVKGMIGFMHHKLETKNIYDKDIAYDLLKLADKYLMEELKDFCQSVLIR